MGIGVSIIMNFLINIILIYKTGRLRSILKPISTLQICSADILSAATGKMPVLQ